MTFNAQETGARTGRKVWLYTWQRGEKIWRYTSADRDLTINFQKYLSAAITHSDIEQSQTDIVRMNNDVQVPMLHPVALLYRTQAPVDSIVLTISEYHANDPANEVRPRWQGRIIACNWDLTVPAAVMTHSPTYTSLQRNGLRRKCQANCPHVLYGPACKASRESYKLATTVSAISGFNVTASGLASFPDGYWSGGFIEYLLEVGVTERRGIRSHTSGTIVLDARPTGLVDGKAFNVYPGCDHTTGANGCAKFNNLPNYGGFPHFAIKNPFGADPVY